ncbi:hypothetical protein [Sulfurovum sp.]|jgi:hypothetical protein|uniref:hypothetical protein n=1 Tax=Sulfurovum sp. TaxID=1969726 RepID=UPI0025F4E794|nr:hypothetical protein [Sulfurovum sp.]
MTKRFMLLIAAMLMGTVAIQANQEPVNMEFTVTQVALDAADENVAEEQDEEDNNVSIKEPQPEGGDTEEK